MVQAAKSVSQGTLPPEALSAARASYCDAVALDREASTLRKSAHLAEVLQQDSQAALKELKALTKEPTHGLAQMMMDPQEDGRTLNDVEEILHGAVRYIKARDAPDWAYSWDQQHSK